MIVEYFRKLAALVAFEIVRSARMMVRYPTNSLVSIVVMTIVFIGLFETATGIVGDDLAERVDVDFTIQKFILWTTMIMGFASVSGAIRDETLSGLIETVWMGAVSPALTLTIRGLTSICVTYAVNLVLASVIAVLYQRLGIFTAGFFFVTFLVSISSLGVGLILGAAVVVFKEIGPALNLLQFAMLPLFMNDARYFGSVVELLAPGLYQLRYLSGDNQPHWAILLAAVWLIGGLGLMAAAVRYSRKHALVYQY